MKTRTLAPVVASLLLLTACGSTVQVKGQAAGSSGIDSAVGSADQGTSSGTQAAVPGTADTGTTDTSVSTSSGRSTSRGSTSTASATSSDPVSTGGSSTSPVTTSSMPASGIGWDAKNVYIGYTNISDNATASPLGYDPGNLPAVMDTLVADVNKHGGLFGRQLKAVQFDRSFADVSASAANSAQAACSYFTQDRTVIAVLNVVPQYDNADNFHTCLAKKKVTELSGSVFQATDSIYKSLSPYFYSLYGASWDRLAGPMVSTLAKAGYFTGWSTDKGAASPTTPVKTGIIYLDTPVGRAVRDAQVKALTAAGHAPAGTYGADGSTSAASANSFIIDMRNKGITHLLSYSVGVASQVAQSQGFYPRWGVSTYNTPASLPRTAGSQQLVGSMGVGWSPAFDVPASDDKGAPTPSGALCTGILRSGGQTFDNSKRFAYAVALTFCDSVRLLVAATQAGGGLDSIGLHRGVGMVGPGFKPSISFGSALSSARQDLPAEIRPLAFNTSCKCYHYLSGAQHF